MVQFGHARTDGLRCLSFIVLSFFPSEVTVPADRAPRSCHACRHRATGGRHERGVTDRSGPPIGMERAMAQETPPRRGMQDLSDLSLGRRESGIAGAGGQRGGGIQAPAYRRRHAGILLLADGGAHWSGHRVDPGDRHIDHRAGAPPRRGGSWRSAGPRPGGEPEGANVDWRLTTEDTQIGLRSLSLSTR